MLKIKLVIRQLHKITLYCVKLTLIDGNLDHLQTATSLEIIPPILSPLKKFQYPIDEIVTSVEKKKNIQNPFLFHLFFKCLHIISLCNFS